MREVMTDAPLSAVFGNVQDQVVKDTFKTSQEIVRIYAAENGITYTIGENSVPSWTMLAVVIGSGCIFLAASMFVMRRVNTSR